jgi:hypothetical protein
MDQMSYEDLQSVLKGLGYKQERIQHLSRVALLNLMKSALGEDISRNSAAPSNSANVQTASFDDDSDDDSDSDDDDEESDDAPRQPARSLLGYYSSIASAPPPAPKPAPAVVPVAVSVPVAAPAPAPAPAPVLVPSASSSLDNFPLPPAFKEAVVVLESMGFKDRARNIEVLINKQGKVDEAMDVLAEERKQRVANRKLEVRAGLVHILNSPEGSHILDHMAELSLDGHDDILDNLRALLVHEGDYGKAKADLESRSNA